MLPLLLVALALPPLAQADPLQAAPCRAALGLLAQEEDAVIARRSGGPPAAPMPRSRLAQLQREAARVCLGEQADREPVAPRVPTLQPVTPLQPLPRAAVPAGSPRQAAGRPALAAPSVVQQRPLVTISQCDAQGCWASDGARVQKQGPLLLGARGYCSGGSRAGAVINCP